MGCDIHIWVQHYGYLGAKKFQQWTTINTENKFPDYEARNYSLFSRLAGVRPRDNIVPLFPDYNLDEEIEREFNNYKQFNDYHSWRVISLKELSKEDWNNGVSQDPDFQEFVNNLLCEYYSELENVRIIIAFDS